MQVEGYAAGCTITATISIPGLNASARVRKQGNEMIILCCYHYHVYRVKTIRR